MFSTEVREETTQVTTGPTVLTESTILLENRSVPSDGKYSEIQSGRRALRCFQNELHHFIILDLKWYQVCQVFRHSS